QRLWARKIIVGTQKQHPVPGRSKSSLPLRLIDPSVRLRYPTHPVGVFLQQFHGAVVGTPVDDDDLYLRVRLSERAQNAVLYLVRHVAGGDDDADRTVLSAHRNLALARCSRNQEYVDLMPASRSMRGVQPRAARRATSSCLRGVPSGFDVSKRREPVNPTTCATVSASSLIVISLPQPTLINLSSSYRSIRNRHASARSSTWRNSRLGVPVPQTSTSRSPPCLASWNLRIRAGSTCEVSRLKLSSGPYRFVGIAAITSKPYCRRYAWHIFRPAIFAIAYHSLVGSRGPVRR